jgi:uncharacterized membrane protein/mono/diheme cytochrome c family protein
MHTVNNLLLFVGHFHPLLVHLPIGGLVLLGTLEFIAATTRWEEAAQNRRWILGFVGVAVCVSAACGWLLAQGRGYDPQLLKWHRAAGLAVAVACLSCVLLHRRGQLRAYRVTMAVTLLLLLVSSHLGGSLTHGRDFLTRYAPGFLRSWLPPFASPQIDPPAREARIQRVVFARLAHPILQQHCLTCHGPEKHKAGLRLDNLEALLQGGQNGPVVKFGRARESSLIQRMLLPVDGDGRMPPEDQPQPTTEEIAVLEWWINTGSLPDRVTPELKPRPEESRALETVSRSSKQVK